MSIRYSISVQLGFHIGALELESAFWSALIWNPIKAFFQFIPEGPDGSDEFSLVLKKPFELESDSSCVRNEVIFNDNLTVTDSGEPPLSNTVPIEIFVTDINNHQPLIKLRQDSNDFPMMSFMLHSDWLRPWERHLDLNPLQQYDISYTRRFTNRNIRFGHRILWSWSM